MRGRKVIAGLLLVVGLASIGGSLYITQQVNEGRLKVQSAEKTVEKGNQLFSLIPDAQGIGKEITDSAKKKINEGKEMIAHYEALALNLKIGGIVLLGLGVGLFLIPTKKR